MVGGDGLPSPPKSSIKGGATHWNDASPTPLSILANRRNSYLFTCCASPERKAASVQIDMPAPTNRKGAKWWTRCPKMIDAILKPIMKAL